MAEVSPGAAWLTLDALVEVKRPGDAAFWRHFRSSRVVGWKTGTSYGLRDGWAVGTTPRYTVAVWVGNASGEGRPGLTGSATAAPILFDLMNRLDPEPWFDPPYLHMKRVEVCKNDGYLAAGGCASELVWVPKHSHFEQVSPFNRRVHLDATGRDRVHGACETPARMTHRSWFVLPPRLEFYYRKHHAEYRPLPDFRGDCRLAAGVEGASGPIAFLYPHAGTKLYIPTDLANKRSETVFEAVHRRADATLYWHLDDVYLGTTTTFHQQGLDMTPGPHVVTVVDEAGNRLSRRFEVLGTRTP
jgi:penicillin-binding protein 1C